MASYIVKSKGLNLDNPKVSIGQFYSGDRFYTLLNEYLDLNLKKRNILLSWIIKILFKSSNFKHDPGIANGQPLAVKVFDWVCVTCLILFVCLSFGSLSTLIPLLTGKFTGDNLLTLQKVLLGLGVPAIVTGIPAFTWLWVYFTVRKKNKPLTLQAFVEKKISFCLKLRFLIKNVEIPTFHNEENHIIVMENFEAQGAQAPRWLNIQMINLICSIFPDFNYIFKFNELSDEEYKVLKPIVDFDFRNLDLTICDDIQLNVWKEHKKGTFFDQIHKLQRKQKVKHNKK